MRHIMVRYLLIVIVATGGLVWNGEVLTISNKAFVSNAEAVVGAPATPVSYAGVARRSAVTPGVGAPGVGVRPGVGVGAPGPGAGVRPANLGGPVNRVGVR